MVVQVETDGYGLQRLRPNSQQVLGLEQPRSEWSKGLLGMRTPLTDGFSGNGRTYGINTWRARRSENGIADLSWGYELGDGRGRDTTDCLGHLLLPCLSVSFGEKSSGRVRPSSLLWTRWKVCTLVKELHD